MLPVKFKRIGLSFQKKKRKIDFQDRGHLEFPIGSILAIFIYKSLQCFLPSFKSNGLSVQEKKQKYFQDDGHGRHLGFPIGTILAIFDLQVTLVLPKQFQAHWPFGSGEERSEREKKKRFSRWRPSWDLNYFSYFDLQVTPMLPTKFQVKWPFSSGEEAKNRFSRWPPRQPSWISDKNGFS